jgi:hypothetical protein
MIPAHPATSLRRVNATRRTDMRIITGIAIALTTLFLSLLAAHAEGTWCANYGGNGGTNCGFYSFAQCQATVSGTGGFCSQNPFKR